MTRKERLVFHLLPTMDIIAAGETADRMLAASSTYDSTLRPYPHPGKHEGGLLIDQYVYELSQAGCDDEAGNCSTCGCWAGVLRGSLEASATARLELELDECECAYLATRAGAIVTESEQGFVSVEYFFSEAVLEVAWATLAAELAEDEEEELTP